jgi:hypothetical protein
MPKGPQPGRMKRATATKVTPHGGACIEENFPGVAVKTKAKPWSEGLVSPQTIAIGEDFNQIVKGVVEVPQVSGAARGAAIYITAASNALSTTATGNVAFGRVVDSQGQRGLPTGKMRVDLDAKDSL